MYKKYFLSAIGITIIFIILRVYVYSEHVKASYYYQTLATQKETLEKNILTLQNNLQTLNSGGYSKKIATDVLGLTPLSLKQVSSLSHTESTT